MSHAHLIRPMALLLISIALVSAGAVFLAKSTVPTTEYFGIGLILLFGGAGIPASALLIYKLSRVSKVVGLKDPNATVVFKRPKWFVLLQTASFATLAVAFNCLALSESTIPYVTYVFKACALLFALLTPVALLGLRQQVTITLSPQGFDYSMSGFGPIEWKDIQHIELMMKSLGQVSLNVTNKEKYFGRRSKLGNAATLIRRLLYSPFAVAGGAADVPVDVLVEAANIRLAHFNLKSATMDNQ